MTSTTDTATPAALSVPGSPWPRLLAAFLVGLVLAIGVGLGAMVAFEREFDGRILPGVSVGGVELSGLAEAEARSRLEGAYAPLASGTVTVETAGGPADLTYATIGRRPDIDAMLAEALAVGRSGSLLDRSIDGVRTYLNGTAIEPQVHLNPQDVAVWLAVLAGRSDIAPTDAAVAVTTKVGFEISPSTWGKALDRQAAADRIVAALSDPAAPATLEVALPLLPVRPIVDDVDAMVAKSRAERIARPVMLAVGKDEFTIPADTVRSWVSFVLTPEGDYQPAVSAAGTEKAVKALAKEIDRKPRNATFLVGKGNAVVGVTASRDGRTLDVAGTTALITDGMERRWRFATDPGPVRPALAIVKPELTTEEAEKAAPLMKKVSEWTTYYPVSEKNGFGANITIPTLAIDGTVVAPGDVFDFWRAIGEVSYAAGYRRGGAIINGRTEPQGALAGGICSCSTTLFNAAARAGYEILSRRNHYYYITRYPLGLDATVFKSSSGSTQTMSFRNDTRFPLLIRGYAGPGWTRFAIYTVPNGREVSFTNAIVKNIRPARDTVQRTSSLPAGTRQRIETPADGKDVWVTRTVRDGTGRIIHRDTWYSHYARIDGIVLVGTGS